MMRVSVIHGPNLNLLGTRQPDIYGDQTLTDLETQINRWGMSMNVDTDFFQSNDESELVDAIQDAAQNHEAILVNAGGFSHTSVAIADAVASVGIPTVEVHLSDISAREPWRHTSLIQPVSVRQISGRGAVGYRDALRHLVNRAAMDFTELRYGPHRDNIGDLRTPDSSSRGIVVLVHGGCWLNPWERDTMESIAVALTNEGYESLNLEYRRRPPWPGSGQDVETAIRKTVNLRNRVAVIGHSAGGYLGLWNQGRRPVDLLIGLAPITDLEQAKGESESISTLIESGAPLSLTASSNTHLLIHGAEDRVVHPSHSGRLREMARVEIVPGNGHFDLLNPSGVSWQLVLKGLAETFG